MNDITLKGETVEALSLARRRDTCLKARASVYRDQFSAAAAVIDDALGGRMDSGEAPSVDRWPAYEDIAALCDGLRESRRKIGELEERLRGWGAIK